MGAFIAFEDTADPEMEEIEEEKQLVTQLCGEDLISTIPEDVFALVFWRVHVLAQGVWTSEFFTLSRVSKYWRSACDYFIRTHYAPYALHDNRLVRYFVDKITSIVVSDKIGVTEFGLSLCTNLTSILAMPREKGEFTAVLASAMYVVSDSSLQPLTKLTTLSLAYATEVSNELLTTMTQLTALDLSSMCISRTKHYCNSQISHRFRCATTPVLKKRQ
jgi:hypothetical protein